LRRIRRSRFHSLTTRIRSRSQFTQVAKLKRLLGFKMTYPAAPFLVAVEQAAHYGFYDLNRLEALILKQVAGSFFDLDTRSEKAGRRSLET